MAKQVKLAARPRSEAGRNAVKKVRARKAVPAVIYGAHETPANLEVDLKAIEQLLAHAASEHVLVDLEIEGSGNKLALIQEVQHHPVRGDILHVDFHAVSTSEKVESEVPIEPVGEAVGVKTYGGVLQQLVRSLAIECLPQDLPEVIHVDVSHLGLAEPLHVKDITLPPGVTTPLDPEITVFLVSEPKVSGESETTEEPAAAAEAAPSEGKAEA